MQRFDTKNTGFRLGQSRALLATLGIVLLGTAGFAAAGGWEVITGWIVTVEVNGEPVDVDGADVELETDGDAVTVSVDGIEGDFEEGAAVTITARSDGTGMTTTTTDCTGKVIKTVEALNKNQDAEKGE